MYLASMEIICWNLVLLLQLFVFIVFPLFYRRDPSIDGIFSYDAASIAFTISITCFLLLIPYIHLLPINSQLRPTSRVKGVTGCVGATLLSRSSSISVIMI